MTTERDEASGLSPRQTFYMPVTIESNDGLLDLGSETHVAYATLDEAVTAASQEADEYGMDIYIYEARPVKRVSRVKVIVEDVGS